ncbi:hypothetical protein ACH5RR_012754 [Cinchona calisaya]|uniref:MULE transposase domain-containing protein n=1 Tax=Cinchona calisaya TaxID=153742 RepID=A0ABD3AA99_9GENT
MESKGEFTSIKFDEEVEFDANNFSSTSDDCDKNEQAYNEQPLVEHGTIEIPEFVDYSTEAVLKRTFENEKPVSVLTYGDKAMQKAIKVVAPEAWHRLCSWHLVQNAKIKVKYDKFVNVFSLLMKKKLSTNEFDYSWARWVEEYRVEKNDWVEMLFRKRDVCAEAYVRGHFLLVWAAHKGAVHKIEDMCLVMTTKTMLLEKHASQIYNRNVFYIVHKHLNWQGLYITIDTIHYPQGCAHVLSKYRVKNTTYVMENERTTHVLRCSFLKFESKGYPFIPMSRVMVLEQMANIPQSCIRLRWGRQDEENMLVYSSKSKASIPQDVTEIAKFGSFTEHCKELSYLGTHVEGKFGNVMGVVDREIGRLKDKWNNSGLGKTKQPRCYDFQRRYGHRVEVWIL